MKDKEGDNKKDKFIEVVSYAYSGLAGAWFIVAVHTQPIWLLSKVFFTFAFVCYIAYHYKLFRGRKK